ncbi:MAG TPA: HAD-IB family hydrolase [Jatrophihabitantaceae bacterium]|jgi:putative phosphoserine phosphatase/1-acylglycerol-3-phosphate O-acyltransferase
MNTAVAERIDEIRSGPSGDKVAAFFDYDGTLIRGYSATTYLRHSLRNREVKPGQLLASVWTALAGVNSELDFARALKVMSPALAGRPAEELDEVGEQLFKHQIAKDFRHELWPIVLAHKQMRHRIVLASSATSFQVEPVGRAIGADDVLCTRLETIDGVLTGRTLGRPLWGPGKAAAVRRYARAHFVELDDSYAYSDGREDVPYLESVGHPTAVSPHRELRAESKKREWTILDLRAPSRPPKPVTAIRTAAYCTTLTSSIVGGTLAAAALRTPSLAAKHGLPLGNAIGLRLAGVDIDVVSGREHLTEARPCVFVANHQSKLDGAILLSLLGTDLAGIGKAEIGKIPGLGRFLASAGVVYVDRANSGKAQAAVAPLVSKLRDERVSVVLAPEGTRSATPELGPFKTGAFHLAMQAGVPVVPIVIRNAGELQWRGGVLMNPGRIEVVVLPPVDSSPWGPETVRQHAADVRDMFATTLAHWPGGNR